MTQMTEENTLNCTHGMRDVGGCLRCLLADVFTLYLKTKNFHWHMSGPHFREYHLLLDEQAGQLFAMTDTIAERARKISMPTIRSIGEIVRRRRLQDSDTVRLASAEMLTELCADNRNLTLFMHEAHSVCEKHGDIATASLLENWIDETEGRVWFLTEAAACFYQPL